MTLPSIVATLLLFILLDAWTLFLSCRLNLGEYNNCVTDTFSRGGSYLAENLAGAGFGLGFVYEKVGGLVGILID